jgi:hypothetical protein
LGGVHCQQYLFTAKVAKKSAKVAKDPLGDGKEGALKTDD